MHKFSAELRAALTRKGMSQNELARRLYPEKYRTGHGVSASSYLSQQIRKGDWKESRMAEIADLLGMEVEIKLVDKQ